MSTTKSSWEDTIQEEESPEVTKSSWEDTIQEESPSTEDSISPEKFSQPEAAIKGFLSSAVPFDEQVIPGFNAAIESLNSRKSLLDEYYNQQRAYKQAKEQASEEHPGSYYSGLAGGMVAGAVLPIGLASKGVSTAAKVASPIKEAVKAGGKVLAQGAAGGALSGESEILKGDIENLPIEMASGAALGGTLGLAPGVLKGTLGLGKSAVTGTGKLLKDTLGSEKYIETPYKYAKQLGEKLTDVPLTAEGSDTLENIALDKFNKQYRDESKKLIEKTKEFREQADIQGLSSNIERELSDINLDTLSGAGKDVISRAQNQNPASMTASQLNELKSELYTLPKADRDISRVKNLLSKIRESEHYLANKISPEYSNLIKKQQAAIEVEDLTGLGYKNISGSSEEAREAAVRDIARSKFQKPGRGSEQLSSEIKNIGSPELSKAYENLDIFKKAQATRKGLSNMTSGLGALTSLPVKTVSSIAGSAGKFVNKVNTSDDFLYKNINRLRTLAGNTSNTASNLADKLQEISQKDPSTRARMMFNIMQQPAYQEYFQNNDNEPEQEQE